MMGTVAIVVAAIALMIAAWALAISLPLRRQVAELSGKLDRLRRDQQRAEQPAEPPAAVDRHRALVDHEERRPAWTPTDLPPRSTAPEPRPYRPRVAPASTPLSELAKPSVGSEAAIERRPSADVGRVAAVRDRVARYRDLLEQRAKPRLLQEVIDGDRQARAVVCDVDGTTLSLATVDANDPGQMLIAFAGPEEDSFVVLPTFEYLENFRVAFSAPVQNPAVIRSLFDLEQDDGSGLRVIDPALVRLDEGGVLRKIRAGRMGGFASGV